MPMDSGKSKSELMAELETARQRIAELETNSRLGQVEQALRESEARCHLLFDTSPEGIGIADPETRKILFANQTFCRMFGYTMEEVKKLRVEDMHPKEFMEYIIAVFHRHLENETATTKQVPCQKKDGTMILADITSSLETFEGRPQLVAFFTDITKRKRAEEALRESEERFRRVTESSKYMVYRMTLPDGAYEYVSHPSLDIFGYSPEEFLQSPLFLREVIHPDWREYLAEQWDQLLQGKAEPAYEYQIIHKSGELRWLYQKNALILDEEGAPVAIEGVVSDITERKRMEQDMVLAKDLAEAANLAKGEFLANMSHEIRTPLNGVLGMLQILEQSPLDEGQRECLETALISGRSLIRIISDILDLSRIESGKMDIKEEPFDLEDALQSVKHALAGEVARKGIVLDCSADATLPEIMMGDSGRIRQILFNLVGNAVKFTEQGGVHLKVCLEASEKEIYHFDLGLIVEDSGIGIPEDKLESIFDPFVQADGSCTRKYGGTGLGMTIVKRLAGLMGGRVELESRVGVGTTVRVTIPTRVAVADPPVAKARPTTQRPSRLAILLAEDDLSNQLVARLLLEKQGHRVTCAATGREVLALLEREPFDLILMDIQMPEMDGEEAARRIRNGEAGGQGRDIPIIALTAHAMAGDKERFIQSGMDEYISKPIDCEELNHVMGLALGKHHTG